MSRRMLSLWLPGLAIDRLIRRQPDRRRALLVTVAPMGGRQGLAAVSAVAAAAGVAPGMALADARAIEPGLLAVPADPAADARALDGLADWCGRYTPWVGLDRPDGLMLDITGCTHFYGPAAAGEPALLADLLGRLGRFGYGARAAVAGTPGAAAALARHGPGRSVVLPPGDLRPALAGLPVEALRLGPEAVAGLRRLGLTRIGDLAALPRAGLAARLGAAVMRRHDQVLGLASDPLTPRRPAPRHAVRLGFAEPIAGTEALSAALRLLLDRLCAGLALAGQGARRLDLACHRSDGRVERLDLGTAAPVRDPGALHRLFALRLDRIDGGFGIEVVVLAAVLTEALAPAQPALAVRAGGGREPRDLGDLIDRLGTRLGVEAVQRVLIRESWWPERAERPVPALCPERGAVWPAERPRPLRLLPRPEPIEVVALLPDAPPRLFRRAGRLHSVHRAEGPERLEPEWWREAAEARDYYRVEDAAGERFWLYRAGRAWFLHGLFA